jgi:DNA-binding NtrC family response regulator
MEKIKVLLVDDEGDFTTVLSERMESRGLEVDVASSGADGVALVRDRAYDAVLLDLAMPGMDGIETLKRMIAENGDLQVILLSGRVTVRSGVEAISSGAIDVIEKPADLDTILKKISEARANRVILTEKKAEETIKNILHRKGW